MEQLEMLWAYQQEDIKADRIADRIRRSPTRQKLEKSRDFILELQKQYKQIDEKLSNMADRLDMIREALPRYEEQLKQLSAKAESDPPADLESARALCTEAKRCRDTISNYEGEIRRIVKDSAAQAKRKAEIRHDAAVARQEFDTTKASYDKELQSEKAELEAQRAVAASKAEGIDKGLLERYAVIKKHTTPPVAKLYYDQCGGCNTSLPSALLRKIKAGSEVIECETCGRMLIL